MDKSISKALFKSLGLPVGKYLEIKRIDWIKNNKEILKSIKYDLKFPMFVKPATTGSSIGVNKAKDEDSLNLLSELRSKFNVFMMLDNLSSGNKSSAFKILQSLLQEGESEIKIISMLAFNTRNMIKVKSSHRESDPSIHPFVRKKLERIVNRYDLERLKSIYGEIFNTDLGVKTGIIESKAAISNIFMMF